MTNAYLPLIPKACPPWRVVLGNAFAFSKLSFGDQHVPKCNPPRRADFGNEDTAAAGVDRDRSWQRLGVADSAELSERNH
jgi:hypothetical protein